MDFETSDQKVEEIEPQSSTTTMQKSLYSNNLSRTRLNTLRENETIDIGVTTLKNGDTQENTRTSKSYHVTKIEEYRTPKGKLVIKQANFEWESSVWINVYLQINKLEESILVYLNNLCTVGTLIGFLKRSNELKDFDDGNVNIYKGDDDGKLSHANIEVLLTRNDVVGKIGVANIYIKSVDYVVMMMEKSGVSDGLSSHPATFTIGTSTSVRSVHVENEEQEEMVKSNENEMEAVEPIENGLTLNNHNSTHKKCCNCVVL